MRSFRSQERRQRPGRASNQPSRRWSLALLGIIALLLPLAHVAAEEPGGAIPVGDFRLLDPIRSSLGASSWMMASGFDPRLWDVPTGGAARGVVDWSSYGGGPAAGAGRRDRARAAAGALPLRRARL